MSNNSSYSGSDWRLRVPKSWTADAATAGFTTGVPFRRPADNVATHNVALEQPDAGSLLNFSRSPMRPGAPYNFGAIGAQTVTLGRPLQLEQTAWNNGGVGHDLLLTVSR
jgi:hypothetical protein